MVGYLSFYFDINNFSDRAMIVLTTMLVIATITSTIKSVIDLLILYTLSIVIKKYTEHTQQFSILFRNYL